MKKIFVSVKEFLEHSDNLIGKECFSYQPGSQSEKKYYPLGNIITFNRYTLEIKNLSDDIFKCENHHVFVEIE